MRQRDQADYSSSLSLKKLNDSRKNQNSNEVIDFIHVYIIKRGIVFISSSEQFCFLQNIL